VISTPFPFAPGSVSLRLYAHDELAAPDIITELCAQARLATEQGFDGVMTSEHHGGLPGYLPNPLQLTSFILDETDRGWAAPCPLVLPLRPAAMVAEEMAWLDARHPGRVGVGVAAGALPLDFAAMGMDAKESVARFKAELPRVARMLRGEGLAGLDGDRALARLADRPIPVVSAASSPAACRRAAECQVGILLDGMTSSERVARLCAEYDRAGGTAGKVVIRRVWIGEALTELIDKQRRVYESYAAPGRSFEADQTIVSNDPHVVANKLNALLVATGADSLNLRVHLPGIGAATVRAQIARLAGEVLPALRSLLARPDDRQQRLSSRRGGGGSVAD
jgi:alkanesulfonate monooxygenase SsuD/methylene tetrahydromethanopterin reductase-like flavin-dependent oxidoreductase (luciferase family)